MSLKPSPIALLAMMVLVIAAMVPTGAADAARRLCVTSDPSGNCGAYGYARIVNSNGYNTYVSNNCWADPHCKQTITARSPGNWKVVGTEPRGNTSVKTYPDVKQLFNNWCGHRWAGCANPTDTPIRALSRLKFGYQLTMPRPRSGTIGQAAYDIWTSDSKRNEIMIWVDNDNRGSGGAKFIASYRTRDGSRWSLYFYGSEVIWSLGRKGTFARQASMARVPVHELMKYLVDHGYEGARSRVGELDFGWEICSTGGRQQTFAVTGYSITRR
jgi:hypothetical protein